MSNPFSKRYGYGESSRTLVHNNASEKLRIGIWNLIEDYINHKSLPTALPNPESLYTKLTSHFCMERERGSFYSDWMKFMVTVSFRWYEVYDLIEFLFTQVFYCDLDQQEMNWLEFPDKVGSARYQYTKDINHILSSENVGWRLRKGQLERIGSEVLDREIIEKTKKLLLNPDFAGPNSQFNKALEFISKRPKPDLENCVKESVGALEGLARILMKDENITLGKAIDQMVGKKIIRKPFDTTFHALYGFVSSEPGSRHGAHVLPSIDSPEAEFVIYNSAVCMLFLAHRFGVISVVDKTLSSDPADDKCPSAGSEEDVPGTPSSDDEDVPF